MDVKIENHSNIDLLREHADQQGSVIRDLRIMITNPNGEGRVGLSFAEALVDHDLAIQLIVDLAEAEGDVENGLADMIGLDRYKKTFENNSLKKLRSVVGQAQDGTGDGLPPSLQGLDGHLAMVYLKAYLGRFAGDDDQLKFEGGRVVAAKPQYRVKVSGKITDYHYIREPVPAGVSTPPVVAGGHGHLSVDMVYEEFDSDDELIACNPTACEFLHWDIDFHRCEVHRRDDAGFPNQPYPGIPLEFPSHSLDPDDGRSIWCRCLDHKLYAEKDDFVVRSVYRRLSGVPKLELLPPEHAYYHNSDDSCIDLMFKGFPPATLPEQKEYCLGRCPHPMIVNTGS